MGKLADHQGGRLMLDRVGTYVSILYGQMKKQDDLFTDKSSMVWVDEYRCIDH